MRLSDSKESVRMALDTLRKNKLRSGLTILGISIGIATVILISSAINGLNTNIDQFVKSLGTNDLWVFRFEPFGHRPTTDELNRKQLTYEDGMAMRSLPYVVAVDPGLTYQNFQTGLGQCLAQEPARTRFQNTILNGDTSEVKETQDIELIEGRMWTDSDEEQRRANVVVLGHDAAEDLFPDEITDRQGRRMRRRHLHRDRRTRQAAAALRQRTQHAGQLSLLPARDLPQDPSRTSRTSGSPSNTTIPPTRHS